MAKYLVALTFLLVVPGCGGSSDTTTPATNVASVTTQAPTTTTAAPTVTAAPSVTAAPTASAVASRPVVPGCTDIFRRAPAFEDGISDHELWIGRLVADQIADQQMLGVGWSVGDGLMIDGVANIWAMNATDHVLHHATFADNEFTDLGPISVNGSVFQGFIDPDAFRLPDGGIGLVAVNGMRVEGTPRPPGPICLMRSDDGQNFEIVQVLLDVPGVQDPAVVVGDEWVLAVKIYNQEVIQLLVGTPDDGFEPTASVPGGDPDLVVESDGSIRLTVCGDGMLKTYISSEGHSWEPSDPIRSQTCGPARITGSDWMLHLPKPGQGGATPHSAGGSAGPADPAPPTPEVTPSGNYDYRLDDGNFLNHLRPDNEACIYQALGEATLQAMRTRPMNQLESDRAMHCFAQGAQPGQLVDPSQPMVEPKQPVGVTWEGPTICTSHGVFYQPPAFGVAVGQPIADPTATVLDDGRIRLYAYAQGIGIVSAVSNDGRLFTEEAGVRIAGTEAGQPRVWRLPDGRWRMYISKVKEIVSFSSEDGLDFIKDPGDRLTARAAGLAAISSPSIVEVEPGLWRMYYSTLAVPGTGPGGKRSGSATSTDLFDWTVDPGWRLGEGAPYLVESAEHPFPVAAADGSVSLFYGKFRASPGGPPDGLWRATSVDGLTFTEEVYTGLYFGNDPEVLLLPSGERIIYYGNFDPAIGGQLLSAACTEW